MFDLYWLTVTFLAIYIEVTNLLKCELNVEYFWHKLNQFINGFSGMLRNAYFLHPQTLSIHFDTVVWTLKTAKVLMCLCSDIDMSSFLNVHFYKIVIAPALRKIQKMYGQMPEERDSISKVWRKYHLSIARRNKQPSNSYQFKGLTPLPSQVSTDGRSSS